MPFPPEVEDLVDRLRSFLTYVRSKTLSGGVDVDRLAQLRRLSDVRLRQFAVGRSHVTVADLSGLLGEEAGGRFDATARECGLLSGGHVALPLEPLSPATGLVVESILALRVLEPGVRPGFLREFVARHGAPVASEPAPDPEPPSRRSLPPAVERLLGGVEDLWSIPPQTRKIQEMLSSPHTPLDPICAEIEKDPGLSARCLRVVNSAFYGSTERVASIHRAVVQMGYEPTRRIVTLASLLNLLGKNAAATGFEVKPFWSHSLWVAHAASLAARASRLGVPEDHFTAGLVHDLGKLVEVQHLPAKLKLILAEVRQGARFEDAEASHLGVNHAVIGACVCERWNFPASVVAAVRHHLDPRPALEEISLPREAFVVAGMCAVSKRSLPRGEMEHWRDLLRLTPEGFSEIQRQATELSLGSLREVLALV